MDFATLKPIEAPSAWLNLDNLDKNIDIVNKKTSAKNLRIATKSLRSLDVLKYIIAKTPHYVGVMSYSASESLYLLENGIDDILCAYPQMDKDSILKCLAFQKQGKKIVWMLDNLEHWQFLNSIVEEANLDEDINVCLDINLSMPLPFLYFGTKRSRTKSLDEVKQLIKKTKEFKRVKLVAIMGYEAQIAGVSEKLPQKAYQAPFIKFLKKLSKKDVSKRRFEIVHWLKTQGYDLRLVNGGGSGSMEFTCQQEEVTEITVGSAYYFPAYFSYMSTMQDLNPAAGFVLQVTRKPEAGVITCHSGGFIASGAIGRDKAPVVLYPNYLDFLQNEGFGEVQTPMQILDKSKQDTINIGDYVWLRHAKAGELSEHFNYFYCYKDGEFKQKFTTYRGEGKAFH